MASDQPDDSSVPVSTRFSMEPLDSQFSDKTFVAPCLPVLTMRSDGEGYFMIGKPSLSNHEFSLSITVVSAESLDLISLDRERGPLNFQLDFLDVEIPTSPFTLDQEIKSETVVATIISNMTDLRQYMSASKLTIKLCQNRVFLASTILNLGLAIPDGDLEGKMLVQFTLEMMPENISMGITKFPKIGVRIEVDRKTMLKTGKRTSEGKPKDGLSVRNSKKGDMVRVKKPTVRDSVKKSEEVGDRVKKSVEERVIVNKSEEKGDSVKKSEEKGDSVEKSEEEGDSVEKSDEEGESVKRSEDEGSCVKKSIDRVSRRDTGKKSLEEVSVRKFMKRDTVQKIRVDKVTDEDSVNKTFNRGLNMAETISKQFPSPTELFSTHSEVRISHADVENEENKVNNVFGSDEVPDKYSHEFEELVVGLKFDTYEEASIYIKRWSDVNKLPLVVRDSCKGNGVRSGRLLYECPHRSKRTQKATKVREKQCVNFTACKSRVNIYQFKKSYFKVTFCIKQHDGHITGDSVYGAYPKVRAMTKKTQEKLMKLEEVGASRRRVADVLGEETGAAELILL